MEINLVVVSVGNSRLAVGPFVAGEMGEVTRVALDAGADAWGEAVGEALNELTEREQEVVRMRFGLDDGQPRTLEEVGRFFGVTRERVRQIGRASCRERVSECV